LDEYERPATACSEPSAAFQVGRPRRREELFPRRNPLRGRRSRPSAAQSRLLASCCDAGRATRWCKSGSVTATVPRPIAA
jgi:hypothetical protein